jgi:hypothetical protein
LNLHLKRIILFRFVNEMHGNKYGSGSEGAWLEEEDFSLEKLSYTSRPAPNQFNKDVRLVKQYFKPTSV